MKKLLAILLALFTLFLVSCGETPAETTTGGTPTETTATPTAHEGVSIHGEVVSSRGHAFVEMESRVLFCTKFERGGDFTAYYSKADGLGYHYCFDPLCDHKTNCMAYRFRVGAPILYLGHVYQNRIYYTGKETNLATRQTRVLIMSCNFDGSDVRKELDTNEHDISFHSCYDRYIYYSVADMRTGGFLFKRFDIETKTVIDITKNGDSGIENSPRYFYNDSMYTTDNTGIIYEYDLDGSNPRTRESIQILRTTSPFCSGSRVLIQSRNETSIYDFETDGVVCTLSALSFNDASILIHGMDEEYIYYLQLSPDAPQKAAMETGKIYRIRLDGTDNKCIYDASDMYVQSTDEFCIIGDTMLIHMAPYALSTSVIGSTDVNYNKEVYVAHIEEDGTLTDVHELVIE